MAERRPLMMLSTRNPWCWAILWAGKVENRSAGCAWWSKFVGQPLALHTSLADAVLPGPLDRLPESVHALYEAMAEPRNGPSALAMAARGAIIGVATLDDVHADAGCCRPWGESQYVGTRDGIRTRIGDVVHLVFRDRVPLDVPIDCPGHLGLRPVPDTAWPDLAAVLYPEEG